ncbi:hypothetical protein DFP72DRAFT_785720, partial [Ephemerocybe angulata]
EGAAGGGKRRAEGDPETPEDSGMGKRARKMARALPDWINPAHEHLLGRSKSEEWIKLTQLWLRFETAVSSMGGAGIGNLPAAFRPIELSNWMKSRQYVAPPDIEDVPAFAKAWRDWWTAMLEGGKGKKGAVKGEKVDIRVIKRAGPTGIVVALIGLGWW